jgi:hypothetical protein
MEEALEEYAGLRVEFRVKPLPPERLLDCVRGLMSDNPAVVDIHSASGVPPAR